MGGQTGPVFYIYYEGMRHPPPLFSHERRSLIWANENTDLRLYRPYPPRWITKKTIHSGWKLTAPLQAVPRTQHRQPVSLFLHGHGERRKEEFHSFTKGRKKVRDRAFRPAEAHQRAESCPVYQSLFRKANTRAKPIWILPELEAAAVTPSFAYPHGYCSKSVSDGNKGGP